MINVRPKSQIKLFYMNRRKSTKLKCAKILRRTASVDMEKNADSLMDTPNFVAKTKQKTSVTELKNVFHFGTMEHVSTEQDANLGITKFLMKPVIFFKYATGLYR